MLQASMTPCPLGAAKGGYFRKMPSDFYPHPQCHLGEVEEITPPITSPHPCNNDALWEFISRSCYMSVGSMLKTSRRSPFSFWQFTRKSMAFPDCCRTIFELTEK